MTQGESKISSFFDINWGIEEAEWGIPVSLQELHINNIIFWDTSLALGSVAECLTNWHSSKIVRDRFQEWEYMYLLFNSDIVNLLLNTNGGRETEGLILLFYWEPSVKY